MKGPWVKLWRCFLEDTKVQMLMKQFGNGCVTLLVTMFTKSEEGRLTISDEEAAYLCQYDIEEYKKILDGVIKCGILYRDADGIICVTNWNKYQIGSSTERVRNYRLRNSCVTPMKQNATVSKRVELELELEKNNIVREPKKTSKTFEKPTIDEVKAYCQERGKGVNPEAWFAHYESNGWRVGKNPMKDWKGAVRTWEHSGYGNDTPPVSHENWSSSRVDIEAERKERDEMAPEIRDALAAKFAALSAKGGRK